MSETNHNTDETYEWKMLYKLSTVAAALETYTGCWVSSGRPHLISAWRERTSSPPRACANYTLNECKHSWRINKECRVGMTFPVWGPLEKPSSDTFLMQYGKMVMKIWMCGSRSSILKVPTYKSSMLFCFLCSYSFILLFYCYIKRFL